MNPTKRLTGVCSECGGAVCFPAELIGTMSTCPRCKQQTELMLALPVEESSGSRKAVILAVVAVGILVVALIVTVVGLKHFEKLAVRQKERAAVPAGAKAAAVAAEFEVSAFALEKGSDGHGLSAVGTVLNTANHPRSKVTLELDLLDAGGQTLEVAHAYRPALEAGGKWEIKLPVAADSKAVSARVASLKAEP